MLRRFRVMRKWPAMLGFVVLTTLLSALPASAHHAWSNYHWARTTPSFALQLGDNVSGTWDTHLRTASSSAGAGNDWSDSSVLDTNVVTGRTNPKRCGAISGRVEVCNSTYGRNGWLGLAQIWVYGDGHIAQGVAKMNDSYSMYETEKLHVMCQEVGHTFGLGHQDESGASLDTCMDYYYNQSNADWTSTRPNAHDYEQLGLIYEHKDSSTTVGAAANSMPAGVPDVALDTPAQWGQLVADYGRASVYVREFGGIRIVTHVTWAEDRDARGR